MANTSSGDPSRVLAKLGILAGPRIGEELPIFSPVANIGQGTQNEVVVPDDSISSVHARLEYENGHWHITDLNSTNGTHVEGVRLAPNVPTPISYGYSVRFGGVRMQFRAADAVDLEAARASYTPPPATPKVAERTGGFRLPVWLFAVILLVLGIVGFFVAGGPGLFQADEPQAETAPPAAQPGAPPGGP